jgi:hypothetical protein
VVVIVGLAGAGAGGARGEEPEPLWEAGLGLAGVSVPDYRGAVEGQQRLLPFPYFVYRGRHVQADRDGLYLFGASRVQLDFSFDASPPVGTGENFERRGMGELLPVVEAGPALNLVLAGGARQRWAVKLRLAGRAAVASNLRRWDWVGVTAAPELQLELRGTAGKLTASLGPLFSSEGVHDHAHEIGAGDAMSDRPRFDAPGGYGGTRLLVRGGWRAGPLWLGAFARYDYLRGAAFADSPLVRSNHAVTIGTAVAWVLARSQRPARR